MGLFINCNPADLYAYNQPAGQKRAKIGKLCNDAIFNGSEQTKKISNSKETNVKNKNEKVSFWEGVKLVGKGFLNKICDIGKSIIKHPIKTLAAVGVTTLALSALPLIGITAATGAAVLAIGFGTYAVFNAGKDTVKAVKHNNNGNYEAVRQDLQNIGGDGVDLALSLPFVPKVINQLKRFAQYGTSTVGVNSELIANLKNIKNIKDIPLEFAKAKTLIDYEMIANEMGLAVKPKLVFKELPFENGAGLMGAFEPTSGELQINLKGLTGLGKALGKLNNMNTEALIRHELEHFRQFSDVARTEGLGIDGLSNTITKYYEGVEKQILPSQMEQLGLSPEVVDNMIRGDKSAFNREFYQQIVNSKGKISAGTQEADMAQQYANGLIEKIKPKAENVAAYNESISGLNMSNIFDQMKAQKAMLEFYKKNILEQEAYAAQDVFYNSNIKLRPNITTNNLEVLSAITDKKFNEIG
ncbi:hypothetical protein IJ541_08165 [bacterium]|nr:hypothetical protein [bacterium]